MFGVFEVRYFGVHSKTNVQEAAAGSKATDDQSSMCFFYSDSRNHVITHYILLLADLQHHVHSTFHDMTSSIGFSEQKSYLQTHPPLWVKRKKSSL